MALSPFKFLFTERAFKYHRSKFHEEGQQLRLKEEFIGYFIGADGSINTSSKPGRLKAYSNEMVNAVARWMRGVGTKPAPLDGTDAEAQFPIQ